MHALVSYKYLNIMIIDRNHKPGNGPKIISPKMSECGQKRMYQKQTLTQQLMKETAILAASRVIYTGYIDVFKGKSIVGMTNTLKIYAK